MTSERPPRPFRERSPEPELPAAPTPVEEPPKPQYEPMESAPRDGTHILLLDEHGNETRCRCYKTRRMEKGRWISTDKWVGAHDFAKIAFEPTGWRRAPEDWEILRAATELARQEDLARRI